MGDWRTGCTPFQRAVYEAVLKIPAGQVRTYGQVAHRIGRPRAARAVGQALTRNRWAPHIPCHRVVAADGLGGYSARGGLRAKRRRLRDEGVRWPFPGVRHRPYFVKRMAVSDTELRQRYLRGTLTPAAFVDRVLGPWRTPPVAPRALVVDPAAYWPSSQRMSPAIARRFRGLAWDLIVRSTDAPPARRRARAAVEELLSRMGGEAVPGRRLRDLADAEVVEMYCQLVRAATGVADPYAAVKRAYNEQALAHLGALGSAVAQVADPRRRWRLAISLGIIANAIDFADPTRRAHLDANGFDTAAARRQAAALRYVVDERPALLAALAAAPGGPVLFLADNAGEIVFDLPLIRLWLAAGRRVILAGKSAPCYNDMTADDLAALVRDPRVREFLGVGRMARLTVLASGTAMIGLDLRRATPALIAAWRRAAIIYAKGQGMVQTLRYAALTRDLFHAVQVKDPAYFHEGVPLKPGDALCLHSRPAPAVDEIRRK